ncbi:MAG: flavin reductase family protein [Solirubrobacteraceae bacterium]|jgi:3-hydroxy-9,10-secoandrosta-1,3,5(10)-triene-9,17-dione monooxygenase reductase component|nr:flavin reductase family protein [Solirubrobacteraceae bacterium]
MPPDQQRFREVMGRLACGVAVVTAEGPDGPAGLTTTAITSVSLEPLLLLACLDRGSRTLPALEAAGRFAVSLLREGQDDVARVFASKRPMPEKFAAALHHPEDGVPVIDGALAWLTCDVRELLPGGDHVIAIGAVTALDADPEGRPLLYFRGEFTGLHFGA